ncbi:DNA-binding protein [Salmonella enterica subsp. enterica]|nr:DNA-binding protein [Salmonella enterica subsp. enterica serovar Abaetetuba]EDT6369307.1 DNA-binding protein [Salmonella enterica subsp. enterica serovar Abaetetuba]EDT6726223.1 DNA-binding protein [Salmonella enterica subsp. enterica serovar Abaetetuba]EDV5459375.1 DNA-binding protein [Salmonella enterica subsp. enterica serovar Abaetetuba]EHK0211132.1 DNA-binding protein [Salmonella enterica]
MTPEQVKNRFRRQGKTITSWALEHNFNRNQVYQVLNGQCKANYGKAYEIAVKLGLKTDIAT